LREVVCPILEFREEKRTFAKVEGGKVDFFPRRMEPIYEPIQQEFLSAHIYVILLRLHSTQTGTKFLGRAKFRLCL
jgi:hypothetical protein